MAPERERVERVERRVYDTRCICTRKEWESGHRDDRTGADRRTEREGARHEAAAMAAVEEREGLEAHAALDKLGVPRAEGVDGDVDHVFTLAERIALFWPRTVASVGGDDGLNTQPIACANPAGATPAGLVERLAVAWVSKRPDLYPGHAKATARFFLHAIADELDARTNDPDESEGFGNACWNVSTYLRTEAER